MRSLLWRLTLRFCRDELWRFKRYNIVLGEATTWNVAAHRVAVLVSELRHEGVDERAIARVEGFARSLAEHAGLASNAFAFYASGARGTAA